CDVTPVTGDAGVTRHEVTSCSPSPSLSLSGSDLVSRSDPPDRSGSPPDWAARAVESVELSTGETFDRPMVWAKYQATRERDGRPLNAPDFRGFLVSWASRQKAERVNQRERGS